MKIQIYILSPSLFPPAPWIPPEFRRRVSLNHLTVVTFFHGEITFQQRGFQGVPWLNCGSAPVCLQYPSTEVTESTAVFCSTAETYFQQGSILGVVKLAVRGRYLQCGEEEEDSLKSSCCAFGATFWLPGGQRSRKTPPAVAMWLSWKSGWGGFWDEVWIGWTLPGAGLVREAAQLFKCSGLSWEFTATYCNYSFSSDPCSWIQEKLWGTGMKGEKNPPWTFFP